MRGSRVEHHFEISLAVRSAIQPNWRYEGLCQLRTPLSSFGSRIHNMEIEPYCSMLRDFLDRGQFCFDLADVKSARSRAL